VRIAPQNYAYELEYQINKYIAVKSAVNVWYIIFVKCEEKNLDQVQIPICKWNNSKSMKKLKTISVSIFFVINLLQT